MLRDIIREGARNRVLQQHFIGFQPVTVDRFHLRRIKIQRHGADADEDTEDYIQNGNARWQWQFQTSKVTPATADGAVVFTDFFGIVL